jgi:5'-3' exonuclease
MGAIGKQTRPEPLDLVKVMTTIPGVGEQKAKALIAQYKSTSLSLPKFLLPHPLWLKLIRLTRRIRASMDTALRALANAGPEELGRVPSVGPALGHVIYDFFHDSFGATNTPF